MKTLFTESKVEPNYSSVEGLKLTYDAVIDLLKRKVKGDLIECGVATGNQLGIMQQALVDNEQERKIIGFDSFCGIPYASEHDTVQPGKTEIDKTKLGVLETTGVTNHPKQHTELNFNRWKLPMDNVTLVEGWFQDTVKNYDGKIALLRLDGDLYESTKVCLEHLLDKVVEGGIIIIDDYNLDGCRKATHEYINEKDIKIEVDGIGYYVKHTDTLDTKKGEVAKQSKKRGRKSSK